MAGAAARPPPACAGSHAAPAGGPGPHTCPTAVAATQTGAPGNRVRHTRQPLQHIHGSGVDQRLRGSGHGGAMACSKWCGCRTWRRVQQGLRGWRARWRCSERQWPRSRSERPRAAGGERARQCLHTSTATLMQLARAGRPYACPSAPTHASRTQPCTAHCGSAYFAGPTAVHHASGACTGARVHAARLAGWELHASHAQSCRAGNCGALPLRLSSARSSAQPWLPQFAATTVVH